MKVSSVSQDRRFAFEKSMHAMDNLAHISPILCVESVVIREGKILLIQRRDDRLWAIPGGAVEVGESLSQAAERELREEAGVNGRAMRLLGVYDSRVWPARTRMQLCIVQFLVETDEIPAVQSINENETSPFLETLDVGFFDEHHLPELSIGHDLRVPMAFKMNREEGRTYFD
jgi:ADP-ribose pyrophosphatase YjhB (NUDIX family)